MAATAQDVKATLPAQQAGGSPSPAAMTTPQKASGMKEQALVKVRMAVKTLERALPEFGYETEEGKAILDILQKCAKTFGKTEDKTDEVMPGEIKQLQQAVAPSYGKQPAPSGGGGPPQVPMPQIPQ